MKSNKKGFTIVELVIVIAIIAILAAVLIPTFASLVKKANVSADTQLVRNLNMAVEIEKASSNAKHSTMHEALMTAQAAGYDVDTIVAKSGYNIAWDSANDRFVLVDKDAKKYIYPTSENTAENSISNPADYFLFCKDATKIGEDKLGYSYYLSRGATLPAGNKLEVTSGLDVGDVNVAEITVKGNAVVRTNGGKLIVNAANGHVEHYGLANEADIQDVSATTYVEHGIVGKMTVAADKSVVLKATAVVGKLEGAGATAVVQDAGSFIGGENTEITVSTYAQLQGLALASTAGINYEGKTIKLANDIDLTGKSWQPFGFDKANGFSGTIDGQGNKIIGLSNGGYVGQIVENKYTPISGDHYGFIAYTKGAVAVKNITFENVNINSKTASVCAAVIGDTNRTDGNDNSETSVTTSLTLTNIVVNGNIKGKDKVAGLVGYVQYVANVQVTDCKVNADISAAAAEDSGYRAGGLFGYMSSCAGTVANCSYTGNVTANTKDGRSWCGLFTSGCATKVIITVKNFTTGEGSQAETTPGKEKCLTVKNSDNACIIGLFDVNELKSGEENTTKVSGSSFKIDSTYDTSNGNTNIHATVKELISTESVES